jgi:GNAT superfamily N-acetyltransferase
MTGPLIRPGEPVDTTAVADLISRAFQQLTVVSWLVPDPSIRQRVLRDDFHILVDHAIRHGRVDVIDDRVAAAVWFRVGDPPPPEPAGYDARLRAACGVWTDRFRHLDKLFEEHHPSEPHDFLSLLAVDPARQRQGLGSVLLAHGHRRTDAAGLAAYLDASSTGSRALYARHGYQPRGTFSTPDGSLFYPMWRPGIG